MKSFIIFACLVLASTALPFGKGSVDLSQDTLGNYKLNYETEDSARTEQRTVDGKVIGGFTYKDNDGAIHTVKYVASEDGFKVDSPTDIPRQVQETAEVAAARKAHLALVAEARALLPILSETPEYLPQGLVAVEEIVYAKTEAESVHKYEDILKANEAHFAAHSEALAFLAEAYRTASPAL